jgi:hypothetical protein
MYYYQRADNNDFSSENTGDCRGGPLQLPVIISVNNSSVICKIKTRLCTKISLHLSQLYRY